MSKKLLRLAFLFGLIALLPVAPTQLAFGKDNVDKDKEKEIKKILKENNRPMSKRLKDAEKANKKALRPNDVRAKEIQKKVEKDNKKLLRKHNKEYKKYLKQAQKEQKELEKSQQIKPKPNEKSTK